MSARGNPLGNVVKDGKEVNVHSANGLDFKVPLLKRIGDEGTFKSTLAKVSMFLIPQHQNNMECNACHADWVPQCYGCHVTVDYSKDKDGKPKMGTDWHTHAHRS